MNVYVGVTDRDWLDYVRTHKMSEVNFWKPGGQSFKALNENDLFLFKLKAKEGGRIVGGGFFVEAPKTSIDWAWRAFGEENGVPSLMELNDKIWGYRKSPGIFDTNAQITSIIVSDVFYFDEGDALDISAKWQANIVSGKTYRGQEAQWLIDAVKARLSRSYTYDPVEKVPMAPPGTILTTTKHRVGQGAFRTLVADAYHRRCAITGERTVPVLQAAHIKAFSSDGPNSVDNGIMLRSDMHALFDAGYITIEYDAVRDPCVVVSKRLHDDFGNGHDYYPYHGKKLQVLPERKECMPAREYLDWHHEKIFLA